MPCAPDDAPKASCFCSNSAIQLAKSDSVPEMTVQAFVGFVNEAKNAAEVRCRHLDFESARVLHPPDEVLSLPLLI